MNGKLNRLALIFVTTILFFGTGFVSAINENNEKDNLKINTVYINGYQDGWPQSILGDPSLWGGIVSPVVEDIDNDGFMELVLTQQTDPVKLYVFRHNGSLMFPPINVPDYISPRSFPSIADIDNDGSKEIIVSGSVTMVIFSSDGVLEDVWDLQDYRSDGGIYVAPVIADLDRDDSLEVIYGGWGFDGCRLVVLNNQGDILPGFPVTLETIQSSEVNTPAVGNFDDDEDLEIVVISHENNQPTELSNIRAINLDGSILWSSQIDVMVIQVPSVGDINNDGYDEVVFVSENGVHILDKDGNFLVNLDLGYDAHSCSVALVDLDDDNLLEMVFGYATSIYAIDISGDILWSYQTGYAAHYPPVIGDIDGDSIPDIIVNSDYEVYAFDSQGTTITGFPIPIETNAYGACSVADIDNDGDIELIASADYKWISQQGNNYNEGIIYVWDILVPYDLTTIQWPMFHHDVYHSGCFDLSSDENLPPEIPEIDGPSSGSAGESYDYTFVSSDPDGHDISYVVDWGDDSPVESYGPGESGVEVTANHTWAEKGTYLIQVKAQDEFGLESDWGTLEIEMPVNHNIVYSLFNLLFNRVLDAFPILRYLFELL